MATEQKKTDNRPYWQKRRDSKLGTTLTPAEEKRNTKDALTVWYNVQMSMMPAQCENCKMSLQATKNFHERAPIAHIVPKTKEGGCPSVATHPLNRWFACLQCHTAYDTESEEVVQTMAVIPIIKERLSHFINQIPADELRRVPAFLLPGAPVAPEEDIIPITHVKKIVKHEQPVKKLKKLANRKKRKVASKKEKPQRGPGGKFISKRAGKQ